MPILSDGDNAAAFLFYVFFSLPILAVGLARSRWLRPPPAANPARLDSRHIIVAGALCVVMNMWHLRGEALNARIADAVVPNAVLAAWLLGTWLSARGGRELGPPGGRGPRRAVAAVRPLLGVAAVVGLLLCTATAVAALGDLPGRLSDTGIADGPRGVHEQLQHVWSEYRAFPPDRLTDPGASSGLARYVYECTRPTDCLLVVGFAPELYFFSARGFAGEIYYMPGYWSSDDEQRRVLARIQRLDVPIVLADLSAYPPFQQAFDIVADHIATYYRMAGDMRFNDDRDYRVLVDVRRGVTGEYGSLALPCFR